jgi:RNA polymerase sigma-70 factor (ECF subfamily)
MPWIVTIARRRLVDHIRSGSGTGRTVVRDAPPEDLSTSAAEARLTAALGMLSADHRLALILRYVDDLAVAEVANHLGRSLRATESILARARAALSAAYDEVADV